MNAPPNEPWNDAQVEKLVQFDEALRLGRDPCLGEAIADADVDEAQQFLRKLQSIWQRAPRKIGPYLLIRSLGQGSIGPCYLVEDRATRQSYILKVLWPDLSAQNQTRELLLQEAKALRVLRHVHVASVREGRAIGTFCYIVSEYSPGKSLAQWRRSHPQPIEWSVAALCVAKLAETLDAAHRQGIVHGNLKPANLFMPADTEVTSQNLHEVPVRIADFALAKTIQQARLPALSGLPWPMPQYLAPEQLSHRRRQAEPASDVYALGVLLYELLTGRSPVKGSTREEVFIQTRDANPPTPRQYRAEIPAELEALVLACLAKDPRARAASAQQLAASLRALVPVTANEQPAWWKQWLGWM